MLVGFEIDPVIAVQPRTIGPDPNKSIVVLQDGIDPYPGNPLGDIYKVVLGRFLLAPDPGESQGKTAKHAATKDAYPVGLHG